MTGNSNSRKSGQLFGHCSRLLMPARMGNFLERNLVGGVLTGQSLLRHTRARQVDDVGGQRSGFRGERRRVEPQVDTLQIRLRVSVVMPSTIENSVTIPAESFPPSMPTFSSGQVTGGSTPPSMIFWLTAERDDQ